MTSVAVIVPTHLRPVELERCLASLARQRTAPDEVVVVARSGDQDVRRVASAALPGAKVLELDEPGVLAAMLAGARSVSSSVVCFTDDDAQVPVDWVERIAAVFDASALVGGVGGRDVLEDPDGTERTGELTSDVGRLMWFGRHVGNHHLGTGEPRDVSFLKGVNAAYRREALGLPTGLRGSGAQAHFEVAVGRYATSHGWRLVYDPSLQVRHRPASRQGADQRGTPASEAVADAAYNLVVVMGGRRGLARVAYASLIGDRGAPGLGRALVGALRGEREVVARLVPSLRGTLAGGVAIVTGRGVTYDTLK